MMPGVIHLPLASTRAASAGAADGDDLAALQQHVGAVQALAGAGQHGRAAQQHRAGGDRLVGAGIGILGVARGGRGRRRLRGAGEQDQAATGQEGSEHGFPPENADLWDWPGPASEP